LAVIVAVPALLGVNVTEQLPELKLQLVGLNEPVAVPDLVKLTVLVGVLDVPAAVVSVTVAVHVEPLLTTTDEGEQLTAADVVRAVTVSVNDCVPVLMLGL
jgi:hypothetical protein